MNQNAIKGISTELLCQAEFIKKGLEIFIPISSYCECDLVVEINQKLYKIQIKTATKGKTGVKLNLRSMYLSANGLVVKKYSADNINFICTYYNGECYLIPMKDIEGRSSLTLSFTSVRTNASDIFLLSDYHINKQIDRVMENKSNPQYSKYLIHQYTKDYRLIATYNTVAEIPLCKDDIKKQSHIGKCINDKRKTAYGYIWERIEYSS